MRIWLRRKHIGIGSSASTLLAGCSGESATPTESAAVAGVARAHRRGARGSWRPVTVEVPEDLAQAPFDEPRQALVPPGWTISVWARVPQAPPDGLGPRRCAARLGARHRAGRAAGAEGAGPRQSLLLDDLNQPHGLAFAGPTLYVAESDQVDAYDYAGGPPPTGAPSPAGSPTPKAPT